MRLSDKKALMVEVEDLKLVVEVVFIPAIVVKKEIVKTKTCFLVVLDTSSNNGP